MGLFDFLKIKRIAKNSEKDYEELERRKIDDEIGAKADALLEKEFDDIGLANEFKEKFYEECEKRKVNPESLFTKYNVKGVYKLRTQLTKDQTFKIVKDFFNDFYPAVGQEVSKILDGEGRTSGGQKIILNVDETAKILPSASIPLYPSDDITLNLPIYGDLRDVYSIVHEIGHTFDCEAGDNETRKMFAEIVPQGFERLLDEFLINTYVKPSDKTFVDIETAKTQIDKANLLLDISDRRLSTFHKRWEEIKRVPYSKGQDKNISSRYMFAQLYQSQLSKKPHDAQKMGLIDFWDYVIDNDWESAIESTGLDIRVKNPEIRTKAIDDCIEEFFKMREQYIELDTQIDPAKRNTAASEVNKEINKEVKTKEEGARNEDGEKN